jgi:hypothetical protein
MATPADQRLLELLDKWLTSLELHLKYSSLDEDSYLQVQPWPEHQRPSRWIIDLAKQNAIVLQSQVQDRIKMGDAKFSDSLELMTFLANLVGAEHIERFIPLAHPETERAMPPAPLDGQVHSPPGDTATATREMPKFPVGKQRAPAASGTDQVARTERKAAEAAPAAKTQSKPTIKPATPDKQPVTAKPAGPATQPKPPSRASTSATSGRPATSDRDIGSEAMREQVIADAARLVQWGRKWYELAELISSMADRPPLTDVRRILKDNKTVIDERAGRS